jgi:hypothetical protein
MEQKSGVLCSYLFDISVLNKTFFLAGECTAKSWIGKILAGRRKVISLRPQWGTIMFNRRQIVN